MSGNPRGHMNTVSKEFWVTADGRRLKPGDMTDDHLKNLVGYLVRRAPGAQLFMAYELDMAVSDVGGEMAQHALEMEAASMEAMRLWDFMHVWCPTWCAIHEEADRRFGEHWSEKQVIEFESSIESEVAVVDSLRMIMLANSIEQPQKERMN